MKPRTTPITSTISGEGKTFVAINLAGIISYSGKRVIILDLDMRKPKIHLGDFEDKTGQNLDPTYLNTTLEQKMRLSGVYEMTSEDAGSDFIGKGVLLRMAERTSGGRISVYTVTLNLMEPASGKVVYSCEATVQGPL